MKIDIKASHIKLTLALREYAEAKIGSLDKFLKRWEVNSGGEIEVWVELDRTTAHHHKGEVFRAVADIKLPKRVLRAEESSEDVRAAIDGVKDKLKIEIQRYKEKSEGR